MTESPDLTVGAFSWAKKNFLESVGYVKNGVTFGTSQRSGKLKNYHDESSGKHKKQLPKP